MRSLLLFIFILTLISPLCAASGDTVRIDSLNQNLFDLVQVDPVSGKAEAQKIIEESHAMGYREGEADALRHLGTGWYYQMEFKTARNTYQKAYDLFAQLGDADGMRKCLNNMIAASNQMGDYLTALELTMEAQKIAEELKDSIAIMRTYVNLSVTQGELKDFEGAIHSLESAIALGEQIGAKEMTATSYGNLAATYIELNRLTDAVVHLKMAIQVYKSLSDSSQSLPPQYLNLANLFINIDEPDSARFYIERGSQLMANQQNYEFRIQMEVTLGTYEVNYGDPQKAIQRYENALNIVRENDYQGRKEKILFDLAEIYAEEKQWPEAIENWKAYLDLHDSLVGLDAINQIRILEQKYKTEKERDSLAHSSERDQLFMRAQAESHQRATLFYLLIISLITIAGLLLGVFWLRLRFKAKKRQIALEAKRLELEHRLLRSQMNPHFLFNSMNTVQSFIASNNTFAAETFLAKFGGLMRMVLEQTRESSISLFKELETMRLYLELERLRFDEKFAYTIEIDPSLEPEFLQIPPMILQPFLENAVLHGIGNKEGKGNILLNVKERGNQLLIEVQDDGVGRAQALKAEPAKKHRSLALQLVQERKELLQTAGNPSFEVLTIDLEDNGKSCGTLVQLLFDLPKI